MQAPKPQVIKDQLLKAAVYLPYATAVLGVFVAVGGYFWVIKPVLGDILPGGATDTAPAIVRLTEAENHKSRLEALSESLAKLPETDLARIRALVPDSPDALPIIMDFESIVVKAGFGLANLMTSVDPKAVDVPNRKTIRIMLDLVAGDYGTLKRFLSLVERNPRIYDIRSLNVSRDSKNYTIEMTTYYLDTTPAPVKPANQP